MNVQKVPLVLVTSMFAVSCAAPRLPQNITESSVVLVQEASELLAPIGILPTAFFRTHQLICELFIRTSGCPGFSSALIPSKHADYYNTERIIWKKLGFGIPQYSLSVHTDDQQLQKELSKVATSNYGRFQHIFITISNKSMSNGRFGSNGSNNVDVDVNNGIHLQLTGKFGKCSNEEDLLRYGKVGVLHKEGVQIWKFTFNGGQAGKKLQQFVIISSNASDETSRSLLSNFDLNWLEESFTERTKVTVGGMSSLRMRTSTMPLVRKLFGEMNATHATIGHFGNKRVFLRNWDTSSDFEYVTQTTKVCRNKRDVSFVNRQSLNIIMYDNLILYYGRS